MYLLLINTINTVLVSFTREKVFLGIDEVIGCLVHLNLTLP